jgi:hypothetical protein
MIEFLDSKGNGEKVEVELETVSKTKAPTKVRYELGLVEDEKDPIYGLFRVIIHSNGRTTSQRVGNICIQLNDKVEVLIPELEAFIQVAIKDYKHCGSFRW